MKILYYLLISVAFVISSCNSYENQIPESVSTQSETNLFDEDLALELGADDYGMRRYVMAFLKVGPNRDQDPGKAAEIQAGHMQNIQRLAAEGKLVLAGPFLDGGEIRGIFIFDVETIEEARILTESDPAIQSGRLVMELHPWYGSAALLKLKEYYPKVTRINP